MAQRFIPIARVQGSYINLNKLFSFNGLQIYVVIGARGYGKTFASKRKLLKDYKYNKRKFVILRDTTAACDEIVDNNGFKLFNDVFSLTPALKQDNYSTNKYSIFFNNELCGEVMPLSTYYKYKGNAYNSGWVLFDEFIAEDCQAYRGNRARQFANTLETIIRDKGTRVILTANALDLGNDILELLGIKIDNGKYGYYINEAKKVVVFYAPNSSEFEARKKNSISSIITAGTFLDAELNKNIFEGQKCYIFERRKPCNLIGIYYNSDGDAVRLYKSKTENIYYACKDVNPNTYNYMRYVFNPKQAGESRLLLDNKARTQLKDLLLNKCIQFESNYIFNIFCTIVNNTKK